MHCWSRPSVDFAANCQTNEGFACLKIGGRKIAAEENCFFLPFLLSPKKEAFCDSPANPFSLDCSKVC